MLTTADRLAESSRLACAPIVGVDGQAITIASPDDALEQGPERARAGEGFALFTLNLDHLVKRRNDPRFREAYGRAALVTADGMPVVRAARRSGARVERTTGSDLIMPLCAAASEETLPVFLFGSSEGVLRAAAGALKRRFPRLDIRGFEAPSTEFDPHAPEADAAAERTARSGARPCFVALGAPKQELFADRALARHPGLGFLCVGAGLDFIAGVQSRAPLAVQRLGFEWLWRLLSDPRRFGKRYAACGVLLARLAVVEPLQRWWAPRGRSRAAGR